MPHFWNPDALPYVISWEAWATLVVGIAAVAGAVWIGIKQASISKQQTLILAQQVIIAAAQARTEETRLRSELYDRRATVYGKIESYLLSAISEKGAVPAEIWAGLFDALSVARFVLDKDAEQLARDIHSISARLRSHSLSLDRAETDEARERITDKMYQNVVQLEELNVRLRANMEKHLALNSTDVTTADAA